MTKITTAQPHDEDNFGLPPIEKAPPVCEQQNFVRLSENGNSFCLWAYMTNHSLQEVLAPTYFRLVRARMLRRHDRLLVTASADGEKPEHAEFAVASVEMIANEGLHLSLERLR